MAITHAETLKAAQRAAACDLEHKIDGLDDLAGDEKLAPAHREARARSALAALPDQETAQRRLERILQGNELTDVNYLERGVVSGQSVARILLRWRGRVVGYGTGFLVAPGVLMTNEHVLGNAEEVAEASVQFRYEYDMAGNELDPAEFPLRTDVPPIFHQGNDFALVGVGSASTTGESLEDFGWLRLDPTPGKGVLGEYLTVIQHPGGERKQVCVRENRLIHYDPEGHYVWYQTDTVGGSSGSPVFNNAWDVVGLHHSGVARTEEDENGDLHYLNKDGDRWQLDEGDDAIDWYANEGIRISRILAYLASAHPNHPLARALLTADPPPTPARRTAGGALTSGSNISLPLRVPLTVSIGNNGGPTITVGGPTSSHASPSVPVADTTSARHSRLPPAHEKVVVIDQTNYDERDGYDANFLGTGKLRVQLPVLESEGLGVVVEVSGSKRVKYYNYTVMMNGERNLAYYCAANVVPAKVKGTRPDDKWFRDTRITGDSDHQIGEEFYGTQRDFEVDRSLNPFDRGHLTARENLQWGDTTAEAVRNGDESYHFTNCAPQHLAFNQNRRLNGLWRGLEEHAIEHTGGVPLCTINGPVFDAPLSTETSTGLLALDPDGARSPDPTFNGVAIPKQYFKIIAWKTPEDRLSAMGFVVTQENVLRGVQRIVWPAVQPEPSEAGLTEGEVLLYQLPIATIGRLTNMRFGRRLSRHDTRPELNETTGVPGLIANLGDVRFFD